ncbi:MAG: IS200/IS605 family transposase [Saprospiraceae bacterium]
MSSFRQIIYHVVLSTYGHEPRLILDHPQEFYAYIGGILRKQQCHPHAINGVSDHIHLLFDLHPTVALSGLIKDIKLASSKWMKEKKVAPLFQRWSSGYGAFTCSVKDLDTVTQYVRRQQVHHQNESFLDEYKRLLTEHRIPFEEQYLMG